MRRRMGLERLYFSWDGVQSDVKDFVKGTPIRELGQSSQLSRIFTVVASG